VRIIRNLSAAVLLCLAAFVTSGAPLRADECTAYPDCNGTEQATVCLSQSYEGCCDDLVFFCQLWCESCTVSQLLENYRCHEHTGSDGDYCTMDCTCQHAT
jgi:hypothetical protein